MSSSEFGFNPEETAHVDLSTGIVDHFKETPEGAALLENIERADRAVLNFKKDFLGSREKDLRPSDGGQEQPRESWFSKRFTDIVKDKRHGEANKLNDKLQQLEDAADRVREEYDIRAKEFNTKSAE